MHADEQEGGGGIRGRRRRGDEHAEAQAQDARPSEGHQLAIQGEEDGRDFIAALPGGRRDEARAGHRAHHMGGSRGDRRVLRGVPHRGAGAHDGVLPDGRVVSGALRNEAAVVASGAGAADEPVGTHAGQRGGVREADAGERGRGKGSRLGRVKNARM